MHLKEVQLRNWRSYRSATFKFPAPRPNKKVILVGAMNGFGKTSLLMALHLGLFGREAMPFLEGVKLGSSDEMIRSYKQLMQQILHRPALDQDDPHASVTLTFAKGDADIVITRTWYYTRGGVPRDLSAQEGEEIRIEVNGRLQRHSGWEEANNRIGNLLFPSHVMPCFFFDGEQAQERVEASGGRALSDAINALFGATALRELDESLRVYLQNQKTNVKRDVGDVRQDELDKKRTRRDEIESEVSRHEHRLLKVESDLALANDARKQKFVELTQLQGDAMLDLEQLARKKADLREQEAALRKQLCDGIANAALPIAFKRWGVGAEQRLRAEIVRDKWALVRDETLSKVDGIVEKAIPRSDSDISPPLTADQVSQLESRMRTALEALWSPPPDGCADDYRFTLFSSSERVAIAERVRALLHAGIGDIASAAADWQATRLKIRDNDRQWESVGSVRPKVEEIKNSYSDLDARVKAASDEKAKLELQLRGLKAELNDLLASIGQMESLKRKLGPLEARLDLGERVRSVLRETKDKLVPLCKVSLADRCTEHLRNMISSEYHNHQVNFDDELQPVLLGARGDRVYVSTLSGAQKRAFGLAFTLAVADVSGEEAPLVIDTPVGNMDSEYRSRILAYLAKSAPGQLIFLSHDEEISGTYADLLQPYVAQSYLLKFEKIADGSGISTPLPDRYFPS